MPTSSSLGRTDTPEWGAPGSVEPRRDDALRGEEVHEEPTPVWGWVDEPIKLAVREDLDPALALLRPDPGVTE